MEQSDQPNWKLDMATVKDLDEFFRVHRTAVAGVMKAMAVPKRGAGYPWIRIWIALGIDLETVKDPDELKKPLMKVSEVASRLGESPTTVRRRGEGKHKDGPFVGHIDLGVRKRVYFPTEIDFWFCDEPLPFERKQEHLSYLTPKKGTKASPGKALKASETEKPLPSSAAAMFMAPPKPT